MNKPAYKDAIDEDPCSDQARPSFVQSTATHCNDTSNHAATDSIATDSTRKLQNDLCRLAQFGANIADAHSCFIFAPKAILSSRSAIGSTPSFPLDTASLVLGGFHSLSTKVKTPCTLSTETGLIGWVARHNRSIHVSPFEQDSRTLGVYQSDQELKSFIAIPISVQLDSVHQLLIGVLACDSKKSFAFSKLQGKLLEDLAQEISNTIELRCKSSMPAIEEFNYAPGWKNFIARAEAYVDTLGLRSVELVRVMFGHTEALEQKLGFRDALDTFESLFRLVRQSIPPGLPVFRTPQPGLTCLTDAMMGAFYENRIQAIVESLGVADLISVGFHRTGLNRASLKRTGLRHRLSQPRHRSHSIESLLLEAMTPSYIQASKQTGRQQNGRESQQEHSTGEFVYEYR